jgi:transcriptional regulator with XRE-family HTH domain
MSHKDRKFNPQVADKFRELTGDFFRERRIELGMTQGDLCRCAGLTQPQLSRFEEGDQNITINTLAALSGCLRMEIQFITKNPDSVPGFPEQEKN